MYRSADRGGIITPFTPYRCTPSQSSLAVHLVPGPRS